MMPPAALPPAYMLLPARFQQVAGELLLSRRLKFR
jgi:hypothetical protein